MRVGKETEISWDGTETPLCGGRIENDMFDSIKVETTVEDFRMSNNNTDKGDIEKEIVAPMVSQADLWSLFLTISSIMFWLNAAQRAVLNWVQSQSKHKKFRDAHCSLLQVCNQEFKGFQMSFLET